MRGITLVAGAFEDGVFTERYNRTDAERKAKKAVKKKNPGRKSSVNPLVGGSMVGKDMQEKADAINSYMPAEYDSNSFVLDVDSVLKEILSTIKPDIRHMYGFTKAQIEEGNVPKEIRLGGALDGAAATAHKGLLALVLRAIDAVFLENIYIQEEDELGRLNYSGVQSQGLLTLMGVLLGEDNKLNNYKLSQKFFAFFEDLRKPGKFFFDDSTQLYFKIKCIFTLDLKALQGVTGRGGGSAIKDLYCTHTCMRKSNKGDPSPFLCDLCFSQKQLSGASEHPCCHMKTMNTSECDKVISDSFKWIDWSKIEDKQQAFCHDILHLREEDIPKVSKGLNKYKEAISKHKTILTSTTNVEKLKEKELDRALAVLDACSREEFRNSLDSHKPIAITKFFNAQRKFEDSSCFHKIQRFPVSRENFPIPLSGPAAVRNGKRNPVPITDCSEYDNDLVRVEYKRKLLIFLIHEADRAEYVASFMIEESRTLLEIDNAALCVLHAEGIIHLNKIYFKIHLS